MIVIRDMLFGVCCACVIVGRGLCSYVMWCCYMVFVVCYMLCLFYLLYVAWCSYSVVFVVCCM